MVVAKFVVNSNDPNATLNPEGATVTLFPVVGGSEENDSFYKWTPGGNIMLSTINLSAAEQFVVGEEKFVVFMSPEEYAMRNGATAREQEDVEDN